jgi:hypothetical protein
MAVEPGTAKRRVKAELFRVALTFTPPGGVHEALSPEGPRVIDPLGLVIVTC